GNFGIEPSQNTVAVPHDGSRDPLDRLEARADGPAVPAVEDELAPLEGRSVVDLLEGEAEPIGARRLQVHADKGVERCALHNGEAPFVLEPEEPAVLELWPKSALDAADLVDGIVDEFDGVELVEGDFSFGKVVGDASDV